MLKLLTDTEPAWLLIVLVAELIFSVLIWRMARIEFEYDKQYNIKMEAREARRKATKKERLEPLEKDMD